MELISSLPDDWPAAPQRDSYKRYCCRGCSNGAALQESIKVLRSVWPKLVGTSIALQSEPGLLKRALSIFVNQAGGFQS